MSGCRSPSSLSHGYTRIRAQACTRRQLVRRARCNASHVHRRGCHAVAHAASRCHCTVAATKPTAVRSNDLSGAAQHKRLENGDAVRISGCTSTRPRHFGAASGHLRNAALTTHPSKRHVARQTCGEAPRRCEDERMASFLLDAYSDRVRRLSPILCHGTPCHACIDPTGWDRTS